MVFNDKDNGNQFLFGKMRNFVMLAGTILRKVRKLLIFQTIRTNDYLAYFDTFSKVQVRERVTVLLRSTNL